MNGIGIFPFSSSHFFSFSVLPQNTIARTYVVCLLCPTSSSFVSVIESSIFTSISLAKNEGVDFLDSSFTRVRGRYFRLLLPTMIFLLQENFVDSQIEARSKREFVAKVFFIILRSSRDKRLFYCHYGKRKE